MRSKTFLFYRGYMFILIFSMLLSTSCEKEPITEEFFSEEQNGVVKDNIISDTVSNINKNINIGDITIFDWCLFVPNLTGYYSANDGGHYYVRHIGQKVFWFGEHPNGIWANVYEGTLSGRTINGGFFDVPKGKIAGKGSLDLKVSCDGKTITKTAGANFGGSVWTKTTRPSYLPPPRVAGFGVRNDIDDLTARWVGDDGGYYYIREYINNIVWFGERNFSYGRPSWSNVAVGSRFGNVLWLDWVDVPKGNAMSTGGILRIQVDNANYMYSVNSTGGFGGTRWWR